MAICAYYCEDCKKEFQVFYVSLKECKSEADCACGKLCPEVFGTNWKQSHGYRAVDE